MCDVLHLGRAAGQAHNFKTPGADEMDPTCIFMQQTWLQERIILMTPLQDFRNITPTLSGQEHPRCE